MAGKQLWTVILGVCLWMPARAGADVDLYQFGPDPDGGHPFAGLVRDSAGNLYGTTTLGGDYRHGTVFRIAPDGTEAILYSFRGGDNNDGQTPYGALILDDASNLYGTTSGGGQFGASGLGTVFRLGTDGSNYAILHTFTGASNDGAIPLAALTLDAAGNLYGTTAYGGGLPPPFPGGTVFKLATDGTFTILQAFPTSQCLGYYSDAPVVFDDAGNLYSTTQYGGVMEESPGGGIVFALRADGSGCVTLHDFAGYPADGDNPQGGLILDDTGNLFGTTLGGGSWNLGTVFRLGTDGTGFTFLHDFTQVASDAAHPRSGLVLDGGGNLYGTTLYNYGGNNKGTVYTLRTDGSGFNLLHMFDDADGSFPEGSLVLDGAGSLFGTTSSGGSPGRGVVFSLQYP